MCLYRQDSARVLIFPSREHRLEDCSTKTMESNESRLDASHAASHDDKAPSSSSPLSIYEPLRVQQKLSVQRNSFYHLIGGDGEGKGQFVKKCHGRENDNPFLVCIFLHSTIGLMMIMIMISFFLKSQAWRAFVEIESRARIRVHSYHYSPPQPPIVNSWLFFCVSTNS
jgi:hypothetical protein